MIDKKSNITELILKYPLMYRIYQRSVRSKYSEYDFIEYIFSKLENKKIRILDLCCGDSYVLNFINAHIDDYLGVDYSEKYLNFSAKSIYSRGVIEFWYQKNATSYQRQCYRAV